MSDELNPNETIAEKTPPTGKTQFINVAPYYDLLMSDVPYDRWIGYLKELLEERNATPRRILDLACGTGNVTERLAAEGFSMTGADIAEHMIAEAKRKAGKKGLSIAYYVQDAAELDLPGEKFDLCISLFDSLNYILDPERLAMAISRVADHLTRNGLFIFDMNSEYALKNHFFDQCNKMSDVRLRYDWKSEYAPDTRICTVSMKFWFRGADEIEQIFEEEHLQFAYRMDEILTMLTDAGFRHFKTYQAYTFRNPSRHCDRIYFIAQKA